jgi:predicted O-linked N-acetylglucosamine transferase (SPINDLY family)
MASSSARAIAPAPVTNLATLLTEATARAAAGDRAGSRAAYREALQRAPERADLWHNLGVLHAADGERDEALEAFAQATTRRDGWAEPWHARGHVLFAAGDIDGALAAFGEAVARDPAHVAAHVNLALTFERLRRYSAAIPPLVRARQLAPADEGIWWILRGALLKLRRDEEALTDFLRFAPLAPPASPRVVVAALASARAAADPLMESRAVADARTHRFALGESALLAEVLALVQYHDVEPATMRDLYRAYDTLVRAELEAAHEAIPLAPAAARERDTRDRRIRLGYLSADFRAHVMGEVIAPLVLAHDAVQFDVRLYSLAPADNEDALTQTLRAASGGFTRLADLDDSLAARAIAADDLDLLVDLMGHSAFARPGIVARKPARVVATHLGHHGCLGLSAVDYKVTDAIADPPANAAYQIEALLPLSVCALPLKPYRAATPRWSRSQLGIADDAVVFEAFVGVQKLSPRCLELWLRIVQAAPRAVLLVSPPRDEDRTALVRRFATFGLPAARIHFVPYERHALHARHALADAALDTLPYTGGDTTASALAAGIPVVTLAGTRHAERMSASILRHAGLPQLVAATDDAYVALAARLATDDAFRDAQRAAVRAALTPSPLTRPAVYTRALETAYLRALTEKKLLPH